MPSDSLLLAEPKPTHRSRVTNASKAIAEADGRSTWVRRYRDLVSAHLSDLGGEAVCSEAVKSIVRRAATLTVELERIDAAFANSATPADKSALDLYQRTANSLRRLLESVGLERRAKDVTPSLEDYIAASAARRAASEAVDP